MIELSEKNVGDYLRQSGRIAGAGEILVQSLAASEASDNTVFKVFDTSGGEKMGTDLRTPGQVKMGKPDTRMSQGACMVLKQPRVCAGDERALAGDETQMETGLARLQMEKEVLDLLVTLLPEGSVPGVLWFDEANGVLGMSCVPTEAVVLKKQLTAGGVSMEGAVHAAMLLAMLHSSTKKDAAVKAKFSDPRFFIQNQLDPMIKATMGRNPALGQALRDASMRVRTPLCLIHGEFSPENILLVPSNEVPGPVTTARQGALPGKSRTGGTKAASISHVMLVDFDAAYFGHNSYDVAKFIADLLLMGFLRGAKWRAFMMMSDNFWQTYRHTADPELVRAAEVAGGRILGALLLGEMDGQKPLVEFQEKPDLQAKVRGLATEILKKPSMTLDEALDEASVHFDDPD